MDTKTMPQICEECPENATCNCDPEMWKCEPDKKAIREALAHWNNHQPTLYWLEKLPSREQLCAWLQQLLDEVERLRFGPSPIEGMIKIQAENERLRKENEMLKESFDGLEMSMNDAISERDDLQKEVEQLQSDKAIAIGHLNRLNAFIDFSQPLDNGDWGIEDASGINFLFAEIRNTLEQTKKSPGTNPGYTKNRRSK